MGGLFGRMSQDEDKIMIGRFYLVLIHEGQLKDNKTSIYKKVIRQIYIGFQGKELFNFYGLKNMVENVAFKIQTIC